jgi:glycosyltransferase involved in cell wall biosynthesis
VSDPALSVVVASVNGRESLVRCLSSLAKSTEPIEVIVVADPSAKQAAKQAIAEGSGIELICLEGRRTIPELRSAGIRRARGAVVAVLGDYYEVDARWASAVLASHRRHPQAAIGGAVENASGDRLVDRAAYLCEYHRFMLPFAEHASTMLPGPNASYDRIVLARECSDLLDRGAWDHVLHERLAARGVRSWMDPSIVAFYTKRLTAADFLMQRYRFGRSYGAARIAAAPLARRLSFAAAAPAIVVLQLWRITSLLLANRRTRRWILPCWPLFALSAVAWSAGEAMGHAFGDGGASLEVR